MPLSLALGAEVGGVEWRPNGADEGTGDGKNTQKSGACVGAGVGCFEWGGVEGEGAVEKIAANR